MKPKRLKLISMTKNMASKTKKDPDLKPIHPGEILKEEFLEPLKLSEEQLAQAIQIQPDIIYQLIQGKERMTTDLAYRLYFYFGVSTQY